ncbi:calcium-binding protein [Sulfitobacter sp. F26169L]|uniref:calcium-binding protein n=1 Tax=Sulfitobacter sp. F26169L TaxID=2996015 RepID=UPI002260AE9F|nr:calcium-binding protein [Sulfitobacter sp. F26169L]MCX7564957.1 calcium-binding protein [Sulfitobacter sp. F26169L]
MTTTSFAFNKIGDPIQVNTFETGPQDQSSFAILSNGDLIVVWRSFNEEGSHQEIYGQRTAVGGNKIGEQFLISSGMDDSIDGETHSSPQVWAKENGGFQVLWSENQTRSYDSEGIAGPIVETDFTMSANIGGAASSREPAKVATNADGTFVRVYVEATTHTESASQYTIFVQVYDENGQTLGEPKPLRSTNVENNSAPITDLLVESIGHGQYAVSWDEELQLPFGEVATHTRVQIVDSDGSVVGNLLVDEQLNDDDHIQGDVPRVTRLTDDGLLLWGFDGKIRRYDADGTYITETEDTFYITFWEEQHAFTTETGALFLDETFWGYSGVLVDSAGNITAKGGIDFSEEQELRPLASTDNMAYLGNQRLIASLKGAEVTLQTIQYTLTFEGTDGDDVLTGMDGGDVLNGLAGNDRLLARDGDDTLNGGNGADTLNGGDGDNLIYGGGGPADLRDVIYAGAGDDTVFAGYGNDLVFGMDGDDQIAGGFGADELHGQNGNDTINGGALADMIFGGDGDDFLNGGFGYDLVNGGAGADKFFHNGTQGHGSDWLQDFDTAEGDVLLFGNPDATVDQFVVRTAHTEAANGERSGDDAVEEAFVVYQPTGQIIWALVDGSGQDQINIQFAGASDLFDLLG